MTAAPSPPKAVIADDEPLLRERLADHLARLWPQLQVVGQARNGREAVELFEAHGPQVVFLDVHMPGMSGIEAARMIGTGAGAQAQIVFVTAYEQYAVQAFERGALDYLVKPFEPERLAQTVERLQARLASPPSPAPLSSVLDELAQALAERRAAATPRLQWIRASVGSTVRLVPVDELIYLRSDEKYTLVVWTGGEALIRKTIRELVEELDGDVFVQVHRSVIVNLKHVAQVTRGSNETADVHLKGRKETLPVSRSFLGVFRQM
jgi:DNA-binding LytR/AlgR family response regulator